MEHLKYPRTPHLPWSPGATADDTWADDSVLDGVRVVVTEKMDGENTTIYRDGIHARSIDSGYHHTRSWVGNLQGQIGYRIPENMRICGENMFAKHSLSYDNLSSYFLAYSIWQDDFCLSWEDTKAWAKEFGVCLVPVLWEGIYETKRFQHGAMSLDTSTQEGYVVRPARAFLASEFSSVVAKWVRPEHVETDDHWMSAISVRNRLTNQEKDGKL